MSLRGAVRCWGMPYIYAPIYGAHVRTVMVVGMLLCAATEWRVAVALLLLQCRRLQGLREASQRLRASERMGSEHAPL